MNDKFKEYLWSSINTFLTTFLTTGAVLISAVPVETAMQPSFWAAVLLTATRAAAKAALQYFLNGRVGEMLGAKGRV